MSLNYQGKTFDTRVEAIDYAVSHMDWLTEADSAQVDICRAMAEDYDAVRAQGADKRKEAAYILRELKNCLAALGGSPEARKELTAKPDEDEDPDEEAVKKMQARAKGKATK